MVEQVIRPTGLIDPVVRIEPAQGPGPRPPGRGQERARTRRAGPGHDADQTPGRRSFAVHEGARPALQVAATRNSTPSSG